MHSVMNQKFKNKDVHRCVNTMNMNSVRDAVL